MIYWLLPILLQVALVIHVIRTGRNTLWIWLIVFVPLVGALAYFAVEILPGIFGSRTARQAASSFKRTIDPTRDLRHAQRRLAATDSIESRRRLADELVDHGKYEEAIEHYRSGLTGIYTHEPVLLLGLANALFNKGEPAEARRALDDLIEHNPDFKSPDGHLLYARALEGEGNMEKAASEYETVIKYFSGAEARYWYGMFLQRAGRQPQAREVFEQLLKDAQLATAHYRKAQKAWLDKAKKEL
jgi:hypothetical protein